VTGVVGGGGLFTVRVAALLTTEPPEFVTVTE
jgi:hypothetical protein